uniref:EF-hand domain-containing protein n=3 Tax=Magallana gigas TaxID=29159 RepID=A0A8W8L513_MAGGI
KENNNMKCIIFTLIVGTVLSQTYHHHDIEMFIDRSFKYVDTDHNGVMVMAELDGAFDVLDVDHDDKLSYAEYTKYSQSAESQLSHDVYNHFDTNKDGFLQRTEYVDSVFSQMDHNGDGQVTRHDYDHFFTNVVQHEMHHGHNGR